MKLAVCLVAALAGSATADIRPSRQDASLLRQKVATITAHAEKQSRQPRRTTVTENEVNSYLVYDAHEPWMTGRLVYRDVWWEHDSTGLRDPDLAEVEARFT